MTHDAYGMMLIVLTFFAVKHFFIDFIAQTPYQYLNKGTYGHPGGLIHAAAHACGTWAGIILLFYATLGVVGLRDQTYLDALCVFEFIAHYHIDYMKMKINQLTGWKADTSEYFWWLLGLDQLLHWLCYIYMLKVLFMGL